MASLSPYLKQRFFDANGDPLVGGKLWSYLAGTVTPKTTYTDETEAAANANPVILDANGEANVWLGAGYYKFVLMNSLDVVQWTQDRVFAQQADSVEFGYVDGEISLVNNQTTFAEISGLILDTTAGLSYSIRFDISRFVTGAELNQSGIIDFVYNTVTAAWDIIPILNGDDCGVEMSVDSYVGVELWKVKYKTTNIAGSGYIGKLKYKTKDIL